MQIVLHPVTDARCQSKWPIPTLVPVTDSQSTPLPGMRGGEATAAQISEKLACLPATFFIGDHVAMFPHLNQRAIVVEDDCVPLRDKVAEMQRGKREGEGAGVKGGRSAACFAVLNGLNLTDRLAVLAKDGEVMNLVVGGGGGGGGGVRGDGSKECSVPVIRLAADQESVTTLSKYQSQDDIEGLDVNGAYVLNGERFFDAWWVHAPRM